MAWCNIRRATDEDRERLEAAAERFMERHSIDRDEFDVVGRLASGIVGRHIAPQYGQSDAECHERTYLRGLWRACIWRALRQRGADGIGCGYVGYSVDSG